MRIDASGNVGLKTTPSAWNTFTASLQIEGASLSGLGANNTALGSNAYYNSAWKYYGTGSATLYQQNAGQHAWSVAGSGTAGNNITFTQAMTLDASGNVGIGTSSPSARLHILTASDETIRLATSTTNPYLSFYESTNRRAYIQYAAGGGGLIIDSEAASAGICFNTQNSERMRIDSSGNVIIGTTTTNNKFRVYLNSSAVGNVTSANFTQDGAGDAALSFLIGAATEWLVGVDNSDSDKFKISNITGGGDFTATGLIITTAGNVSISGSLSKGSGSFRIDHPLPQLTETHQLVHSFVEAPKADLIYRGRVTLVNGKAIVNIDEIATMTEGTFEVLCCDVQCFTTNESDWTPVRGSVTGNILTIESQDALAKSDISWMVIGERKDKHMMDTDWTDDNGKVIVEPLKEIAALESK
jgi:hypothetical protein